MNKKIQNYCDMMNIVFEETSIGEFRFYQEIGDSVDYDFLRLPVELVEFYPEEALKELIHAVKENRSYLNIPTSGRYPWEEA